MRNMIVSTQRGDEVHVNPSGGLLWVLLEPLGRDVVRTTSTSSRNWSQRQSDHCKK